jgi:hypothetical protein
VEPQVPGESVLEVTAGPVFVDDPGLLTATRLSLAWYPDDVWRHVVASAWNRVDQDLPSVGRAGQVGDEPGSRLVASRVCTTAVHLAFLLSRPWPPYGKWRGTALRRLPVGPDLEFALGEVSRAPTWPARQKALAVLLEVCRRLQHDVGLPVGARATRPFYERPFLQLDPEVADDLLAGVQDPSVRGLPAGVGCVDQWVDAVDVLVVPHNRRAAVRAFLGAG